MLPATLEPHSIFIFECIFRGNIRPLQFSGKQQSINKVFLWQSFCFVLFSNKFFSQKFGFKIQSFNRLKKIDLAKAIYFFLFLHFSLCVLRNTNAKLAETSPFYVFKRVVEHKDLECSEFRVVCVYFTLISPNKL